MSIKRDNKRFLFLAGQKIITPVWQVVRITINIYFTLFFSFHPSTVHDRREREERLPLASLYSSLSIHPQFTTDPNVKNDYHSLVILLVEFLPSIVIGLLNGIYPVIFDLLVKAEGYRPATVIKVNLIRSACLFYFILFSTLDRVILNQSVLASNPHSTVPASFWCKQMPVFLNMSDDKDNWTRHRAISRQSQYLSSWRKFAASSSARTPDPQFAAMHSTDWAYRVVSSFYATKYIEYFICMWTNCNCCVFQDGVPAPGVPCHDRSLPVCTNHLQWQDLLWDWPELVPCNIG